MAGDPQEIRRHGRAHGPLRSRRAAVLVVAVLATAALAGCGGSSHKKSGHAGSKGGSSTQRTTTTAATPRALASGYDTVSDDNRQETYKVSIYALRRVGSFLELDFGVRCLNPNPGCQVLNAFGPGWDLGSRGILVDANAPSGVGLVDPLDLREYLPVRDAENYPYTSYFPQGDEGITDSLVHLEWARYALPSDTASSLDVVIPNSGLVFVHVPITSGPAPTPGSIYRAAQPDTFSASGGLTEPAESLTAITGNTTGSDHEAPGQAQITLQSDVLFKFGKSNLTAKAQSILSSVAQQIKSRARGTVRVTGYTDSIGTNAVNIPLSQARAQSVVKALQPLTPGVSYTAAGMGSADPVAPNTNQDGSDNPAGRALNRRVTIAFSATVTRPAPPPATSGPPAASSGQSGSMTFLAPGIGNTDHYRVSSPILYRDGDLMVLTMTLACVSGRGNQCDPSDELAGFPTAPPQPFFPNTFLGLAPTNSISGFYLLDRSTGAVYVPVVRSDTAPLTAGLNIDFIDPGDNYRMWIYFPAAPSTTTGLSLVSPGGVASISDIPIGAGPSSTSALP